MIALVLIYFVGKAFYDLAGLYNKSKWGFAVLGVVSYYAGILIAGFVMGILAEFGVFSVDGIPDLTLSFIALPIGVLACLGTYALLKRQWSRSVQKVKSEDVLDRDLIK